MVKMSEAKAQYINEIIGTVFGEDMRKFFEKQIFEVVDLGNGFLYEIEKPSIEKDYCYSFDEFADCHNGGNSYQEAVEHECRGVSKDEFFAKNLKEIERNLDLLKNKRLYKAQRYNKYLKGVYVRACEWDEESNVSEEERNKIVAGVEKMKEAFVKRLESYWKRFGNSKLNTWSYSVND